MANTSNEKIPIIIPAYEPDERLLELLAELHNNDLTNIILVDDGSGDAYRDIFDRACNLIEPFGGKVLIHEVNRGKGRALKTAFEYVLSECSGVIGAVTADSDGQHRMECICKVVEALDNNRDSLVLGVRSFDDKDIPWKSRFGNNLTLGVLKLVSGLKVRDTQTGLRGIPAKFMEELLQVPGERFEFETKMLLESVGKYPITEVAIETIYDSKENHQTHFNPLVDSIKIYKVLFGQFVGYMLSSGSSFLIDIILFSIFTYFFRKSGSELYIMYATAAARILSSLYNYLVNYLFVFKSSEKKVKSLAKYYTLAVCLLLASGTIVTLLAKILPFINETIIKMLVDTILFVISYQIQKKIVFKRCAK